jgi:vacuolar-type H+-ATPase subunit H
MASTTQQFKSEAEHAAGKMKNEAEHVGNKIKSEAEHAANKAGNVFDATVERAKETASSAMQTASKAASDVASNVGKKADEATTAVGGGLKSLGQSIRENTPHSGMIGQASDAVAKSLEHTGDYLQHEGLEGMATDMTNVIRRNPLTAILIAAGLGFLVARSCSRS